MKGRKKQYFCTMGWLLLTGAWMFSSCADDEWVKNEPATTGKGIFFGITPADSIWQPDTRSTTSGKNFVLRGENTEDTLCVSTSVLEGINASREVHSRGTTLNSLAEKSFNVTAYYYSADNVTTPSTTYFTNETVTVSGDGQNTNMENTYYWPQNGNLTFLATANGDNNLTIKDTNEKGDYFSTPSLSYTVPDKVENQKDVMVAYTHKATSGIAVPLTFNHLCAAVQFQLTSEVENAISSISISGVKGGKVNYMYQDGNWTPDLSECADKEYSINFESPIENGTAITSDDNNTTLLLAPQTLSADAKITVNFNDNRPPVSTSSGALKDKEWKMGQTYMFKLSITPEYTLEFISEPKVQDAHYVIYPIKIKADKLPEGGWTLTSNDTENVTFVEKFSDDGIKNLVEQGYWLKDYCGKNTLTSSSSGEILIYVFLKENISDKDRDIILSLTPANNSNANPTKFTFKQYSPAWNNNIGVERIQNKYYPWGFNWDSNMKITYSMPYNLNSAIIHVLFTIFGDLSYVTQEGLVITDNWKVTVDFSKIPTLNVAINDSDGIQNTWDIYNFAGVNQASSIMSQLEAWGGVADKTLPTNPNEFAARACAMKNQFDVETKTEKGQTIYVPTLSKDDMVWYLPAKDEASNMQDNLSGDYWTSTAITNPGTTAYKYTAGSSTSAEERSATIQVRAVRKKPTTNTAQ